MAEPAFEMLLKLNFIPLQQEGHKEAATLKCTADTNEPINQETKAPQCWDKSGNTLSQG